MNKTACKFQQEEVMKYRMMNNIADKVTWKKRYNHPLTKVEKAYCDINNIPTKHNPNNNGWYIIKGICSL